MWKDARPYGPPRTLIDWLMVPLYAIMERFPYYGSNHHGSPW